MGRSSAPTRREVRVPSTGTGKRSAWDAACRERSAFAWFLPPHDIDRTRAISHRSRARRMAGPRRRRLHRAHRPIWERRDADGMHYGFVADPRHANLLGVVQGGMLMTFADRALGLCAWGGGRRNVRSKHRCSAAAGRARVAWPFGGPAHDAFHYLRPNPITQGPFTYFLDDVITLCFQSSRRKQWK